MSYTTFQVSYLIVLIYVKSWIAYNFVKSSPKNMIETLIESV